MASKQVEKLDDNSVKIIETPDSVPVTQIVSTYTYNDLQSQLDALKQQKQNIDDSFDAQIAALTDTLSQADKLGVVPIAVDVNPVIEPPTKPLV